MQWKKTLIVVSHDRNFLNSVYSHTIHLQDLCHSHIEAIMRRSRNVKQKMKESIKRLICRRSR